MLAEPEQQYSLPIPLEIHEYIFNFLDDATDVAHLLQVNSYFQNHGPRLWQQLIKIYFPYLPALEPQAYRDQAQQLFRTEYQRRKEQDCFHFKVTPQQWLKILKGDLSEIPSLTHPHQAYSLAAVMGNEHAFEHVPTYTLEFSQILAFAIINGDKSAITTIKEFWGNEAYNDLAGRALVEAVKKGRIDLVKYVMNNFLMDHKDLGEILIVSAELNLLELVRLVLKIEKQYNHLQYPTDTNPSTALMRTVRSSKHIFIETKTAAMKGAIQQGNFEVVKLCFEHFGFEIDELNQFHLARHAFTHERFDTISLLFPHYREAICSAANYSSMFLEKFAIALPDIFQGLLSELKQPLPLTFKYTSNSCIDEITSQEFEWDTPVDENESRPPLTEVEWHALSEWNPTSTEATEWEPSVDATAWEPTNNRPSAL